MTTLVGADTIRVALVDDHTLIRQSVARVVDSIDGFSVVTEAGSADEAVLCVQLHRPDLLIMDVGMPGRSGIDIGTELKRLRPELKLIFLTMHEDDATIAQAVALGADGYVLKSATTEELLMAVKAVASGGSYLSPSVARRVMTRAVARPAIALTDRELEIVGMLARGSRPVEVARTLCLSLRTVRNHLANVYAKLGVSSAAQAVAEAFNRGLVAPND